MEKKVYSVDGKEVKSIELSDSVFAREVSEGSIYNAIRNELANRRVGTACTKGRSEVKGSGAKPWRQKGTGRARSGHKRSPVWVGGGIVFGPKPRDYSYQLPKKIKRLAIKSILSLKAANDEKFKVVEDFTVESGKTKDLVKVLKNLVSDERTVLILKDDDSMIKRAGANIANVNILSYNRLNAHDLFYGKNVLVLEGAALKLNEFYTN
ncbi:MAG: 50S ribosomal protein L4 [Spirochaetales bacterium]|nr:50S ribosomal protein L4 [Spirochaetales bacterium]